jgi:uncharacterized protein
MTIDGYCTVGAAGDFSADAATLLREMDAARVDRAIIASGDRYLAFENRAGNEALRRIASAHPDRLIPSCAVSPWNPEATEELRRCRGEGAAVLVVHSFRQGFLLDEEVMQPLIEFSSPLPVYVHTGSPGGATPAGLFHLARLYPERAFIMGHSGATDYWTDVPAVVSATRNLFLESSFARPFIFRSHCLAVGFDRGIMGSGFPCNPLPFEWRMMEEIMPRPDYPGIYGETLASILPAGVVR